MIPAREILQRAHEISRRYNDLPAEAKLRAFGSALYDPFMQNRRVKGISTGAANYTKEEIASMLRNASGFEKPLRAVWAALERVAYPAWHARTTYQNLLSYHNYIAPAFLEDAESKDKRFWHEWKLLERLRAKLNPADTCHMITGQALREGKVFYHPRISADKSSGDVRFAFLQQLPSDHIKIVGLNNVSKYTVAFDLMYFLTTPGASPEQFGDLFAPFFPAFRDALIRPGPKQRIVRADLDTQKILDAGDGRVEAEFQDGRWFYWVTLPVDSVFPFEIDDTDRSVLPVFTGLYTEFMQLQQLEQIALSLLQNPLIQVLVGEIPFWSDRAGGEDNQYKLDEKALGYFIDLWYLTMAQAGTDGISIFGAPLANLHLESVAEAPGASEIVSKGYKDLMSQAGLTAIIPTGSEARAGAVNVSLAIESRLPQTIYRCYERMMSSVIENLGLQYEWCFHMFGDLATDADREKRLREDMTLGLLPAAIEYNAMKDRSLLKGLAWSRAVAGSGIMDKCIPLKSSWQDSGGGGRPASETVSSDGNEQDADGRG